MTTHHSSGGAPANPDRRSFLGLLSWGLQGVIGLFLTIPIVRYVLHPALVSTAAGERWIEAGDFSDIQVGEPQRKILSIVERDGWAERSAEKAVWVVRNPDDKAMVYTAVCPHLGCTINWKNESKNFNCACHQSYFDLAGKLLSGPAPRAMDQLEYKIENGVLIVKYQDFKQGISSKDVLA